MGYRPFSNPAGLLRIAVNTSTLANNFQRHGHELPAR
jgi:hypothetical protein